MTDIGKIFGGGDVDTFMGVPRGDLADPKPGAGILGVPLATPYGSTGAYAKESPSAGRAAMAAYAPARGHHDFDLGGVPFPAAGGAGIHDYGNLDLSEEDFAANRAAISEAVAALRRAGAVPVLIGGDDSIPIPVLAAYADSPSLHILQLDAHIDWRDEVDGERNGLSSNMRRASEMDHVAGITQVGARGIGSARSGDVDDAAAWGAGLFPMGSLDGSGFGEVVKTLPEGGDLFINLDIDSLDPSVVPAVIGPAPGGLGFREAVELMKAAAGRCRIVGFALTELYPALDAGGRSAMVAGRLVAIAAGLALRQ